MERAKMRSRDEILSLVGVDWVESKLVGHPFPILSNEVVRRSKTLRRAKVPYFRIYDL
jgi:hypothetical protein